MARPSKYPAEFRARGVQLYRDSEDRTIAEVARELGVGAETFRKWVRQDEADRGEAPEKPTSAQLAELARLKRENTELRRTNEILGWQAVFSPRRPTRPAAAVRFVQDHREEFGVAPLCRVLGWRCRRLRPPGPAGVAACCRGCGTGREIEKIWADSGRSYGSPRVHARQARDGIRVGRKRVERIMADNGWQGAYLRRGWKITTQPGEPAAPVPDLVGRDFTAQRPNQLWVAEITYVRTMVGLPALPRNCGHVFYLLVTWNHSGGRLFVPRRHHGLRGPVHCVVILEEKWPVLGRHQRAAEWLRIWVDLGRAPRTIDAYARGLAEFLLVCEREGIDPVVANRSQIALFVKDLRTQPSRRVPISTSFRDAVDNDDSVSRLISVASIPSTANYFPDRFRARINEATCWRLTMCRSVCPVAAGCRLVPTAVWSMGSRTDDPHSDAAWASPLTVETSS